MAVASLFAYPAISALIGIDYSRALAFPARSVTLALATPVVNNLGISSITSFDFRRLNSASGCVGDTERHHRRTSRRLHTKIPPHPAW